LVHGVTSEVDVRLAKISARSRNILLVLSSVKRRPPQRVFKHKEKGRGHQQKRSRESPRRKEKDRQERKREKKRRIEVMLRSAIYSYGGK